VLGYAGTLDWAQQDAAAAIDLWERGETATAQARAQHQQDEQQAAQQAAAAGEPAPTPAPFNDPGESLREQARQKLSTARGEVGSAGDVASGAVDRAGPRAATSANSPCW
jgi:exonuclease VII small subunit